MFFESPMNLKAKIFSTQFQLYTPTIDFNKVSSCHRNIPEENKANEAGKPGMGLGDWFILS